MKTSQLSVKGCKYFNKKAIWFSVPFGFSSVTVFDPRRIHLSKQSTTTRDYDKCASVVSIYGYAFT